MKNWFRELSTALRSLLRRPAFSSLAVLLIALGVGPNSLIFSVVDSVLLRPLPVEEPERLVSLYTSLEDRALSGFRFYPISLPTYQDVRDLSDAFEELAAYRTLPAYLGEVERPRRIAAQIVTGNFFETLGVAAARGRMFNSRDERDEGASTAVVLSHRLWSRQYGADPEIVGSKVLVNGHPFDVVGVAPRGFLGVDVGLTPELWLPMAARRQIIPNPDFYTLRRALYFTLVGRLVPGQSPAAAEQSLKIFSGQLASMHPEAYEGRGLRPVPLLEARLNPNFRGGVLLGVGLLLGTVGLVLLIVCANVANLLLARALDRRRELAVRLALGAPRGMLIRQMATESFLLVLAGGLLGLLLVRWGGDLIESFQPPIPVPVVLDLRLGGNVLAFTFLICLVTAVLCGLLPALKATRSDLIPLLKDQAAHDGRRGPGLGRLLIAGQVALSAVALVAAGLFVQSLNQARNVDPGFEDRKLLLASVDLGLQGFEEGRSRHFYRTAEARLDSLPQVAAAGFAETVPLYVGILRSVTFPGREKAAGEPSRGPLIGINVVSEGFFDAMGIPVLEGRSFNHLDRQDTRAAAVVNETLAQRYWPGETALGKQLRILGDERSFDIVGIARNAKYISLHEEPRPYIYLALEQNFRPTMNLHVRTAEQPHRQWPTILREVATLEPELPVFEQRTIGRILDESLWTRRLGATLFGAFGLLALLLSLLGLYGVMAYNVGQRTRELGIRTALGAGSRRLVTMVLLQAAGTVAAGLAVGLGGGFLLSRLLTRLLPEAGVQAAAVSGAVAALLLLTALAATLPPALRAARVDPVLALRQD